MNKRDRERQSDMVDSTSWLGGQTSSSGSLCFKPPSGVSLFKPDKGGTFLLDIYPFKAGKKHPTHPGKRVPDCMYYRHGQVGPNRDKVLCPGQTYRTRCFVCEYRAKLGGEAEPDKDTKKLIDDIKSKQRQLWNVFNHDEPKKGWQILEESFFLFGKNINERIMAARPGDVARFSNFWHPGAAGMTLEVVATEKQNPGYSAFIDFGQIAFKERSPKLIARLDGLGEPHCLDACLRETPYDEVKKIFLAVGGGGADDTKDAALDDEDDGAADSDLDDEEDSEDDDTDEEEDDDEDEAEDGDDDAAEEDEDEEEDEEEEDEVAPPCKKGQTVKFKTKSGAKGTGKVVLVTADRVKIKDADDDIYRVPYSGIIKVVK